MELDNRGYQKQLPPSLHLYRSCYIDGGARRTGRQIPGVDDRILEQSVVAVAEIGRRCWDRIDAVDHSVLIGIDVFGIGAGGLAPDRIEVSHERDSRFWSSAVV